MEIAFKLFMSSTFSCSYFFRNTFVEGLLQFKLIDDNQKVLFFRKQRKRHILYIRKLDPRLHLALMSKIKLILPIYLQATRY